MIEVPHTEAAAAAITLDALHKANIIRQAEWCAGGDPEPDLAFRGVELAGETGEALNVIKKLERERRGWRGSRASMTDLAEELADVVICADLCAVSAGIDLGAAVVAKFNATSDKVGLTTKLAATPHQAKDDGLREAADWIDASVSANGHMVFLGEDDLERGASLAADLRAALSRTQARPAEKCYPYSEAKDWPHWSCPDCRGKTFARVDEQKADKSFGPGPLIRCVNCKAVFDTSTQARPAADPVGADELVDAMLCALLDWKPDRKPERSSVSYGLDTWREQMRRALKVALAPRPASQAPAASAGREGLADERRLEVTTGSDGRFVLSSLGGGMPIAIRMTEAEAAEVVAALAPAAQPGPASREEIKGDHRKKLIDILMSQFDAPDRIIAAAADAILAARLGAESVAGETLETIAQWCETTFGPIQPDRIVSRAAEEMDELRAEPTRVEEAADVVIVLARYPGLWAEIQRKMKINRARRWRLMGDGTGYHIKEPTPASGAEPGKGDA